MWVTSGIEGISSRIEGLSNRMEYARRRNEFVGFDNASYMDIALYMSKVIHCDLVYANVSSWSYWTSLDLERWSHKNRFLLIKVTPAREVITEILHKAVHTKRLRLCGFLGNYSLFVRPDYKRVELKMENTSKNLFGSAYLSPDGKKLVAVYTNLSSTRYDVRADIGSAE